MVETNTQTELYWLIGTIVVLVLFLLVVASAASLNDFSRELKYLNSEIGRTSGAERRHWLKRRRKLWLSLLPFVRY